MGFSLERQELVAGLNALTVSLVYTRTCDIMATPMCNFVCIAADSWPVHTSEWPLGIVYMDLDLVPSAIAVVPDRDVASQGVSLGMQSFTGYLNKMA